MPISLDKLSSISREMTDPHTTRNILAEFLQDRPDTIVSSSFGPGSAVLLKLVTDVAPHTPVIWVDTGHNTENTYQFVDLLSAKLHLNLCIYHPKRSVAHRQAANQALSCSIDQSADAEEIKLEPFRRALREHAPEFWLTGIRQQDNDFRRSLGVISAGPGEIIKVAPLFYWSNEDMNNFLIEHDLPDEGHYFDPTKLIQNKECGLHCRL